MRILIAVHGYPPTHNGGAERRAARTASGILARSHEVRVLCVESVSASEISARWEDKEQDGVLVRRLALSSANRTDAFRESYDNHQTGRAFADLMEEWRPDVVHLFSGYLLSASVARKAIERGVPLVVSLTDYWWLCHRINLIDSAGARCDGPTTIGCARCYAETFRRYRWPARVWPWGVTRLWQAAGAIGGLGIRLGLPAQAQRADVLLQTLRSADALIAPSRYLADFYVRHGVDQHKVRVWRQGVDLARRMERKPANVLRFGYLGQMKYHKGVDLLLEAWSRLRGEHPRHLRLYGSSVGEEAYGKRLRRMIDRLEDVTWSAPFQGAEVWRVLADLDVLVVPSRWAENSPNVILEAQAAGVPVVGSDFGGVAELVQHGRNGLLFRMDDAVDLANQLQRLLDEPGLMDRLRQGAIPLPTVDDEIGQLEELYTELAQRSAFRTGASECVA